MSGPSPWWFLKQAVEREKRMAFTEEEQEKLKQIGEQLKKSITDFAEVIGTATASTLRGAASRLKASLEQIEKDLDPVIKKEEAAKKDMKQ